MNEGQQNAEDPRLALVFEESARAISQQGDNLDRLHTRAGLVLSAAAITSGLFGAQILRDGSLTCWSWAALGAFTVVAAAAIYVLWPRTWHFSNSASTLLKVWVDDEDASIDTMRREVAEFNQENFDKNRDQLGRLYVGFQVASAALGAEVVFWLIDLGTR